MARKPSDPSPARARTRQHLSKMLAAAAGVALNLSGATAAADVTPPEKGKGDKKPADAQKDKGKKPDRVGYEVVDMMPEPFEDPAEMGVLHLDSKPPGATITIDGRRIPSKTPQSKLKLSPGTHAITLVAPDKSVHNFTVEIKRGQTVKATFDLTPKPPEPKPPKTP